MHLQDIGRVGLQKRENQTILINYLEAEIGEQTPCND